MIKFSGRTQPLEEYGSFEAIRMLGEMGFDGVEICLENADVHPSMMDAALMEKLGIHTLDMGLKTWVISWHKTYIDDDTAFIQLQKLIPLVPLSGNNILIIGDASAKNTRDEWTKMSQRTKLLSKIAEDNGIILAKEPEPNFIVGTSEDMIRLIKEIGSPNLKCNLDLGHVFLCDDNPKASIMGLGNNIVHGHIENMAKGIHKHLLPWDGDMDLSFYLKYLAEAGFEGSLALDLYGLDYKSAAPQCLEFFRNIKY